MPGYLTKRNGFWQFARRVPQEFATLDPRGVIKLSTKVAVSTDRRGVKAGKIADQMNRDLEACWRGEAAGRYAEARSPARTFGFDYAETAELANRSTLEVLERLEKLLERLEKLMTAGRVEDAKQLAVQPIAPGLVKNLVGLSKAYAEATGVKITTVGTNSTKTASFYSDLESGKTSCTLRKYDLLTKWFEENWPEGHAMPKLEDPPHYPTH
jgi:hypothetical protein